SQGGGPQGIEREQAERRRDGDDGVAVRRDGAEHRRDGDAAHDQRGGSRPASHAPDTLATIAGARTSSVLPLPSTSLAMAEMTAAIAPASAAANSKSGTFGNAGCSGSSGG